MYAMWVFVCVFIYTAVQNIFYGFFLFNLFQ